MSSSNWTELMRGSDGRTTSLTALVGSLTVLLLSPVSAEGQLAHRDTAIAVRTLSIGSIDGPEEYALGRVSAVAFTPDGSIVVADEQASLVRLYSPEGVHAHLLGGPGEGPGEFLAPVSITIGDSGLIYVRDARRVTVFAPSSFEVVDTWPGPIFPSSNLPSRIDRERRYFYPYSHSLQRSGAPPEHFYLVYRNRAVVDTLRVPSYPNIRNTEPAWVRTSVSGGRSFPGLNTVPFAAMPVWDVTPNGTVVSGGGIEQRVVETGLSGDTLRIVETGGGRVRVPSSERKDSLAALHRRVDSLPVPLSRVLNVPDSVRDGYTPEYLPAYTAVYVDPTAGLWVRRWPEYRSEWRTVFDVYAQNGKHQCTVAFRETLAADVAPAFAQSYLAGVVRDEATDVDRVVVWRYRCPESDAEGRH